ncbi:hypothetical protein G3O00_35500 [Burkholderia sp. Ac-20384]|uniref:hypothetical protein n=1 Tax=Burkholderia sp. Ac-20384 TaxID=2703902 RepID=UPI00198051A3|nr:hypothetical protein [Burkholderia sp. Ac-20384]MBN3828871.1 hypothetical protein [Burkholderia sp. Ac-20384]
MNSTFSTGTAWLNRTLFPWFDPSNATHTIILGAIGSILATVAVAFSVRLMFGVWRVAKGVAIDENRKNKRYLRKLERRGRLFRFWREAGPAQRIHYVVIRAVSALGAACTVVACQCFLAFGWLNQQAQEDAPKNIVSLINVAMHPVKGYGVAELIEQNYVPVAILGCIGAVSAFGTALSLVAGVLYSVQLAEIEDGDVLLKVINAIRGELRMESVEWGDDVFRMKRSLFFPS